MPEPRYTIPLYEAKASDLRPGTFIIVTCLTCKHSCEIPTNYLRQLLPREYRVRDLQRRFKCVECGHRWATMDARRALEMEKPR
jgi:hypothetical protein